MNGYYFIFSTLMLYNSKEDVGCACRIKPGTIKSMSHFVPENEREINRLTPSALARGVKRIISREFEVQNVT